MASGEKGNFESLEVQRLFEFQMSGVAIANSGGEKLNGLLRGENSAVLLRVIQVGV
jgi:hypothetical protein